METLVYEGASSVMLTNIARLVRPDDAEDLAAKVSGWSIEKSNPMIKWIVGDFVESDAPNGNKQMWTKDDLASAEHTIKYAPLNMVHRTRQPVGFVQSTKSVEIDTAAEKAPKRIKIQALSGMWSHVFPFESALVDSANDKGLLFYSMECRGTHLHCAGDDGCDETFEYMAFDEHCEHLKERTSVRHIVNPTFRGSALIIPPVKPGWKDAKASVIQEAVMAEAAKLAELHEAAYDDANTEAEVTPAQWEWLMGTIVSLAAA